MALVNAFSELQKIDFGDITLVIAAVPAAHHLWRYISAWHDGDYEFDGIDGRIGIVD